jgi:hypothetical protein
MKPAAVLACAAAMTMLCACASVSGDREAQVAAASSGYAPIVFVQNLPASFCQDVALSDRRRAQMSGFDTPTLERIAERSLQQCHFLMPALQSPYSRIASAQ